MINFSKTNLPLVYVRSKTFNIFFFLQYRRKFKKHNFKLHCIIIIYVTILLFKYDHSRIYGRFTPRGSSTAVIIFRVPNHSNASEAGGFDSTVLKIK